MAKGKVNRRETDKEKFLIECDQDKSLNILNRKQILKDGYETPKIGESVRFVHRRKNYSGRVKLISDDDKVLEIMMKTKGKRENDEESITPKSPTMKRTRLKGKVPTSAEAKTSCDDQIEKVNEVGKRKNKNEHYGTNQETFEVIKIAKKKRSLNVSKASSLNTSLDVSCEVTPSQIQRKEEARKSDIHKLKKLKEQDPNRSPSKVDLLREIAELRERNNILTRGKIDESRKENVQSINNLETECVKLAPGIIPKNRPIIYSSDDDSSDQSFREPKGSYDESNKNILLEEKPDENSEISEGERDLYEDPSAKQEETDVTANSENKPSIPLRILPTARDQVYGKDFTGETMIPLGDDVFCRESIFEEAKAQSSPSSCARKLLFGVFREEVLLKATLSGQTGTSQGREAYQSVKMICLNSTVLKVIYGTTLELTKNERNWKEEEATPEKLKETIKSKLCEFRRLHKKNLSLQVKK